MHFNSVYSPNYCTSMVYIVQIIALQWCIHIKTIPFRPYAICSSGIHKHIIIYINIYTHIFEREILPSFYPNTTGLNY